MSSAKIPPAYVTYRVLLVVVAAVLLAVAAYGLVLVGPVIWQGVLWMVNGVRGAWTAMDWDLF